MQEGDGAGGRSLRRRHPLLRVRPRPGVALHRRDLRVANLRQRVVQQRSEPCRRPDEPAPRRQRSDHRHREDERLLGGFPVEFPREVAES